ncbi:TOBE domain-containing protein [Polaromonas sp. P1(28)-13]|nr:TOBE domain-containing protein [Polaromonas sp. P1(28)-13]
MNFIPFEAALASGATSATIGAAPVGLPALCEAVPARPLLYGVRPEHVSLTADSAFRAEVLGTEYLGTCQIVTLATAPGSTLRAKIDVKTPVRRGDHVGLAFDAAQITLFDQASGRSIRTLRDDVPVGAPRARSSPWLI